MQHIENIPSQARERMKILVAKMDRLPTLPTILTKVLEVAEDPDSRAKDLETVIMHAPSISAKVISFANSPYYGFARKVETLSHAIALIGFNTVRDIAIGLSTFSCFHDPYSPLAPKVKEIYMHSFAVGLASEQLATRSPVCRVEPAFLCGLLHDIGKMVMIKLLDLNYYNILEIARDKVAPVVQVEKEVLGFDHAEAGAWLVDSWRLPEIFVTTTYDHHSADPEKDALTQVVVLSNTLIRKMGIGSGGELLSTEVDSIALEQLSLSEKDLSETMERIDQAKESILEMSLS